MLNVFKTVKGKIIFLSMCMLLILCLVTTIFVFQFYRYEKKLNRESYNLKIASLTLSTNKYINVLETNTKDLALIGKLFYSLKEFSLESNVYNNSQNNLYSIGGGVFFEPYVINPSKNTFFAYSYKGSNINNVESPLLQKDYNYFKAHWYNEIVKDLLNGKKIVWTKPYYANVPTSDLITSIGTGIYDNSNKLIGIAVVGWKLNNFYNGILKYIPTKDSKILIADNEKNIIFFISNGENEYTNNYELIGKSLGALPWYNKNLKNWQKTKIDDVEYITFVRELNNKMLLVVNVPEKRIFGDIYAYFIKTFILLLITICLVVALTYKILLKHVYNPIAYIMKTAKKIGDGDLNLKINDTKLGEFAELATVLNNMTQSIQEQVANITKITSEKETFYKELNIAKTIQTSALPSTFPAFPNRSELDIYAIMEAAKEVGGDFYDYFFIDSNHFAYLIADVSGKGVPAALFMMQVKNIVRNYAKRGTEIKALIEKVNQKIYQSNTQGFFVTMFFAIIDLRTGKMSFVNAGHNPPLLKHASGQYEYLKVNPNLVLGIVKDVEYKIENVTLSPNDTMILYTDGITETINSNREFYGEDRLRHSLNNIHRDSSLNEILTSVIENTKQFAGEEEQADDITMLIFQYKGKKMLEHEASDFIQDNNADRITLLAKNENWNKVLDWLEIFCKNTKIKADDSMKLTLILEEIFVNVSSYAYPDNTGDITIYIEKNNEQVELKIIDGGIQYNPLDKNNPQIDLDVDIQDKELGGYGVFLIKQMAESVSYEYKNQENILTVKFKLESEG